MIEIAMQEPSVIKVNTKEERTQLSNANRRENTLSQILKKCQQRRDVCICIERCLYNPGKGPIVRIEPG